MLNSTILDVAVGVIFGFLAISLFTSAAVEAINSLLKLRSKGLVSGVKALVNDPNFDGLAQQLFAHAAVNPRGPGPSDPLKNSPSYIDATQFARALLDISGLSATSATAAAQAPGPQAIAALQANVNGVADPQIKQLLQGVINRCSGDIQQIETELASWFDAAMDRISGDFKRWTQLATFIIALVVAFVINLDSVRVATLLWEQPMLADRLKASSQLPQEREIRKQSKQRKLISRQCWKRGSRSAGRRVTLWRRATRTGIGSRFGLWKTTIIRIWVLRTPCAASSDGSSPPSLLYLAHPSGSTRFKP
jgi:hypothetical protein